MLVLAKFVLLVLVISSLLAVVPTNAQKIKHYVALMLENRAFDHMCGFLNRLNPEIDGISPTNPATNTYNGEKYTSGAYPAQYVAAWDPDHSFQAMTMEIMGANYPADIQPAPMSGYIHQAAINGGKPLSEVMSAFTPERVPAISTLAMEYAIFDRYFVSFPGETVINRLFFHMGSSDSTVNGGTKKIIEGWEGKTIYDFFTEQNVTWNAYFEDISDLWYMNSMRSLEDIAERFHFVDTFKKDAAAGSLKQFSWISPRFYPDFGKQARDQHPDHPVYEGEELIAEVYAAVRNSPKWNETALMIFYDENGGFFDSHFPPNNIPNPIPGKPSTEVDPPFNFTRGGPRVCMVMVSPLIRRGRVIHDPVPGRVGGYEATSIFNTLRDLWGFENKPLTARQAWASSWAHIFDLETPRTDCPTSVPTPNVTAAERAMYEKMSNAKPPSGLQREFYELVEALHGRDGSGFERFKTKIELGRYVSEQHRLFIEMKKKEAAEKKKNGGGNKKKVLRELKKKN